MKKLKYIILFIIVSIFCGCSLPSTSIKQEMVLNDICTNITSSLEPYKTPSHVGETIHTQNLTIVYNADVICPNDTDFALQYINIESFFKNDYVNIMNYFSPDAKWEKDCTFTISEYKEKILSADKKFSDETRKANYIAYIEEMMENAKEYDESIPFSFRGIRKGDRFFAYSKNPIHNTYSSFFGVMGGNTYEYLRDNGNPLICESYLESNESHQDFEVTPLISESAAQDIAEKTMLDLGVDPNIKLFSSEKAISYEGEKVKARGWSFIYMRTNRTLQYPFISGYEIWYNSNIPCYAAPWENECVFICVDDNGIMKFDVRGLGKQGEVVYDHVQLLPFIDVVDKITKQMLDQHAISFDDTTDRSLEISEIELCSCLVNHKNNRRHGISIPAWRVLYGLNYTLPSGVCETSQFNTFFSAIDGSYIEPRVSMDHLTMIYQE